MPNYPLYSILELHKMPPEDLKGIADNYAIETVEGKGKQRIIYEILDAQDKQIKIEA